MPYSISVMLLLHFRVFHTQRTHMKVMNHYYLLLSHISRCFHSQKTNYKKRPYLCLLVYHGLLALLDFIIHVRSNDFDRTMPVD